MIVQAVSRFSAGFWDATATAVKKKHVKYAAQLCAVLSSSLVARVL
jgi:hypothetical protein